MIEEQIKVGVRPSFHANDDLAQSETRLAFESLGGLSPGIPGGLSPGMPGDDEVLSTLRSQDFNAEQFLIHRHSSLLLLSLLDLSNHSLLILIRPAQYAHQCHQCPAISGYTKARPPWSLPKPVEADQSKRESCTLLPNRDAKAAAQGLERKQHG
jgi:hypothetical protein